MGEARIATDAPARDGRRGMVCLDTSGNTRIPILMEMVGAMSRARSPQEVLRDYAQGIQRLAAMPGYVSLSTRGLEPGAYRITRMITDGDVAALGDIDPWTPDAALPVHRGGFLGEVIRQAYPEIILHLDLRDDPVVGDALAGFGSLMAIPLFDDGEPLNWAIMLRHEPEGFTEQDLENSILRANLVGTTVRNVLAAQEVRRAHDAVRAEMRQIARIQRALLPDPMPTIPGVALGASYETFDTAGGDLYGVRALRRTDDGRDDPHGPWAILMADASGHGPAAAVVMAMLYAILEAYPREPRGAGEVLEHANVHLCAKRIEHSFVTAFLGLYEPETRRFTWARAGHPPPIWMHRPAAGDPWTMTPLDDVGGMPLGVLDDATYEDRTVQLAPQQSVVLYTDGVTEATDPDGVPFEVRGVLRSLHECSGAPDCVISHVTGALAEHEAGERPRDDQTILVMRVE